jgi:hypothetical protein
VVINQVTFKESKLAWDLAAQSNSLHAPFYTWEWHNDWYTTLGSSWEPFTLDVEGCIAPFARKNNEIIFSGGDEIADYLDIIGSDTKKPQAWEMILPFLQSKGITEVHLRNIPQNSSTISYFQKLNPASIEKEDTTPILSLPASWDIYKESLDRKYRHELERKIRKFNREHIDGQIIESTDPEADIHILFDLMEKDEEKKLFLTSEMKIFFSTIARTFKENVCLSYVTVGDQHIAVTFSFLSDTTLYLYNSGFDKTLYANAGFYLKAMSIKHALDKGITFYNFLQGNERYKYELGAKDFGVYTITINKIGV